LLAWLARREGFRLSQIFNFERRTWKGDLPLVIAATVVAAPLGYFPNPLLARALFDSPGVVIPMMFQPLPEWAIVVVACPYGPNRPPGAGFRTACGKLLARFLLLCRGRYFVEPHGSVRVLMRTRETLFAATASGSSSATSCCYGRGVGFSS
jgi:hypothetical protein